MRNVCVHSVPSVPSEIAVTLWSTFTVIVFFLKSHSCVHVIPEALWSWLSDETLFLEDTLRLWKRKGSLGQQRKKWNSALRKIIACQSCFIQNEAISYKDSGAGRLLLWVCWSTWIHRRRVTVSLTTRNEIWQWFLNINTQKQPEKIWFSVFRQCVWFTYCIFTLFYQVSKVLVDVVGVFLRIWVTFTDKQRSISVTLQ